MPKLIYNTKNKLKNILHPITFREEKKRKRKRKLKYYKTKHPKITNQDMKTEEINTIADKAVTVTVKTAEEAFT